ncbi:MAG: hypothetical protein ACRC3B_11400, partial [Bacteroidia bacterium]
MDDFKFFDTILPWEQRVNIPQIWNKADLIKLQMQADFGPHSVDIIDVDDAVVSTVSYQNLLPNLNNPDLKLWQVDIDLSALPDGTYTLRRRSGSVTPFFVESRPISICVNHQQALLLDYSDTRSNKGVIFWDD